MKIYFNFKHMEYSEPLRQFAHARTMDRLRPFCSGNCWMHITFEACSTENMVQIDFFLGYGQHLYANAVAAEMQQACDEAIDSIVKQISKRNAGEHTNQRRSETTFTNSHPASFLTESSYDDILKFESRDHITTN